MPQFNGAWHFSDYHNNYTTLKKVYKPAMHLQSPLSVAVCRFCLQIFSGWRTWIKIREKCRLVIDIKKTSNFILLLPVYNSAAAGVVYIRHTQSIILSLLHGWRLRLLVYHAWILWKCSANLKQIASKTVDMLVTRRYSCWACCRSSSLRKWDERKVISRALKPGEVFLILVF